MLHVQRFFNKGKEFWVKELAQVGAGMEFDKVIESQIPPSADQGYGEPIIVNAILGGSMVDVYKNGKIIYVHSKG